MIEPANQPKLVAAAGQHLRVPGCDGRAERSEIELGDEWHKLKACGELVADCLAAGSVAVLIHQVAHPILNVGSDRQAVGPNGRLLGEGHRVLGRTEPVDGRRSDLAVGTR